MFKYNIDDIVTKVGGSYQATGSIKARFLADDGTPRYVFRFDNPPGLLHIFNENQIAKPTEKLQNIEISSTLKSKISNWFGL